MEKFRALYAYCQSLSSLPIGTNAIKDKILEVSGIKEIKRHHHAALRLTPKLIP